MSDQSSPKSSVSQSVMLTPSSSSGALPLQHTSAAKSRKKRASMLLVSSSSRDKYPQSPSRPGSFMAPDPQPVHGTRGPFRDPLARKEQWVWKLSRSTNPLINSSFSSPIIASSSSSGKSSSNSTSRLPDGAQSALTSDGSLDSDAIRRQHVTVDPRFFHKTLLNEHLPASFVMPGIEDEPVEMLISQSLTAAAIKEKIMQAAQETLNDLDFHDDPRTYTLKHPRQYILRIKGVEPPLYIFTEAIPLHRVTILQVCNKTFITPHLELVEVNDAIDPLAAERSSKHLFARELRMHVGIDTLIGEGELNQYCKWKNDEIRCFRTSLARVRLSVMEHRRQACPSGEDALPVYVNAEPLPLQVPSSGILMKCCTPAGDLVSVSAGLNITGAALKAACFSKYARVHRDETQGKEPGDYVLKSAGLQEYLVGEAHQLLEYDFIRRCLSKAKEIELLLIPKTALAGLMADRSSTVELEPTIVDNILSHVRTEPDPDEPVISIYDLKQPLRVFIDAVHRVPREAYDGANPSSFFIVIALYHGGRLITPRASTFDVPACANPCWNQWISFPSLLIKDIPRGARISFTLFKRINRSSSSSSSASNPGPSAPSSSMDAEAMGAAARSDEGYSGDPTESDDIAPLGWISRSLITHQDSLRHGIEAFRMWPNDKADPIGTCCEYFGAADAPVIFIEFPTHGRLVVFPKDPPPSPWTERHPSTEETASIKEKLDAIIANDPLHLLTPEEAQLIWTHRLYCSLHGRALSWFLQAVRWQDSAQVLEAHRMLQLWARPSPMQALELLDAKFSDPNVRGYAVARLDELPDSECTDFILQLTQVLKHETYHDSKLASWLLTRALNNEIIGQAFFWHLKAEMHTLDIAERYAMLLEAYLRGCGSKRDQLSKQESVLTQLIDVANAVKEAKSAEKKKEVLHAGLRKVRFPERFQMPLDQRWEASGTIVESCKFMDSKKLPLWLNFSNVDTVGNPKPLTVIFKVGDDLRQDVLTLQLLRLMDKLWKQSGLDLRLRPYGCVATGDEIGMIEVVLNSDTTANINARAGGAKALLNKDTLTNWLREHNPGDKFLKAQENFKLSSAGYCVATYVLGIGDRHNDNIMMTKEGHLFHIDFGHFLGNYKKKFNIKRERAPFVFTRQYADVLGGRRSPVFKEFLQTCAHAYNVLRKHAETFINLFQLMLCGGIPELRKAEDIDHLRVALQLGLSETEAAAHFGRLVGISLNTKATTIDHFIHILVHKQ